RPTTPQPNPLLPHLTTHLIISQPIHTTQPPPKQLPSTLQKMITLPKPPHLHPPPQPPSYIPNQLANHQPAQTPLQKLFSHIPTPYQDPQRRYTRILKVRPPPGDGA
ncbi:L17 family ribosomal protein, partial [Priestia megaterium]|uniref:L17 family ribosomal protein n=1 Tax=Priestia megaterium TaxID=1404 RepID=UPI0012B78E65